MGFVTALSLRFPTLDTFSACGTLYRLAHTSSPVATTPRDCFTGSCRLVEAADKLPTALYSVKRLAPFLRAAAVESRTFRFPQTTLKRGAILGCTYKRSRLHVIILAHYPYGCQERSCFAGTARTRYPKAYHAKNIYSGASGYALERTTAMKMPPANGRIASIVSSRLVIASIFLPPIE